MAVERGAVEAEFAKRRGRQHVATAAAVLLILVLAVLNARSGRLGPNFKDLILAAQLAVIVAFIFFSWQNWRCPVCNRHLGGDLYRQRCGRCRARLR